MCIRIVERYAACRCEYYIHNVQPCASHGVSGHVVQERTVYVGQNCPKHTRRRQCHDSVSRQFMPTRSINEHHNSHLSRRGRHSRVLAGIEP
ncbi:hypothetical protein BDV97DRAFT_299370 [Delphinella strobiligena]|nr:hypothetical protein BDV97DRAFT_299370 [Delphinella strobiligena]